VSPRESIGTATMENDTIALQLRAEARQAGRRRRVTYPKSHKEYDNILKHWRPQTASNRPPFPE
jgi:hypothetical protein